MTLEAVNRYKAKIRAHYQSVWGEEGMEIKVPNGPIHEMPEGFVIWEFPPRVNRNMWTYATCCMSVVTDSLPLELHMFAPNRSAEIVEILTATAHYHRTGEKLGLGHTVNFGKPWIDRSPSEYGLVSLPYLDGPALEALNLHNSVEVKFLWLIPILRSEVEYKKEHGLESLEQQFELKDFNFIDPLRKSVCEQ